MGKEEERPRPRNATRSTVVGPRRAVTLVATTVLGILLLFLLLDPAQAPAPIAPLVEQDADEPLDYAPVEATLVADVRSVHAGETFHAGVLLRMRPGWHVFWKDPGEAGLPTLVDLRVPADFGLGTLRWPTPVGFRQPGDLIGYGYSDWVLLGATVEPPAELAMDREVPVRARAEWLTCERTCEPGEADLELLLPVGGDRSPTDAEELFASWERRLPVASDAPDRPLSVAVAREAEGDVTTRYEVLLRWLEPPESIEWFPVAIADLELLQAQPSSSSTTRLSFLTTRLTATTEVHGELDSVLAYTDALGVRRGVELAIPLTGPP